MAGSHQFFLVVTSFLLMAFTGYCALELATRLRSAHAEARLFWFAGGAVVLGTGLWLGHFTGMLAYPISTAANYDMGYTASAWLASVAASAIALYIIQRERLHRWQFLSGALFMVVVIAAMHYIDLSALGVATMAAHDFRLICLWVLIAGFISAAAIRVFRRITTEVSHPRLLHKLSISIIVGLVLTMMHYTGMLANRLSFTDVLQAVNNGLRDSSFPVFVSIVSLLLIFGAIFMALYERRKREREQIERTDPLTKLPNRHALQTQLPELISRAKTKCTTLHVALIDIDAFKLVNHTHGHAAGDEVLVTAARRIEECLRQHDMVVRVGGDEYMAILCGAKGSVSSIMNRIIKNLNMPITIGTDSITISASVGLAEYAAGENIEALLSRADTARHHAKRDGRNTWRTFSPEMDGERVATVETHKGLRRAFERNEFLLYYQPKYRSGTRDIVGVEALIRWKDPLRGLRMPGEFIGVAERTGLIAPLGDWVLNEACRQIGCWMKQGWLVPVSINMSALQVRNLEIAGKVQEALMQHNVSAGALTLEITESVAIENPLQAMKVFQSLRDCGVSISIDDFGTGYSSLAYLRDFPAGELKIDKAFVRDIANNRQALELVKAIVAMGHALGMLVVAEGVEDEATTHLLENLGCDVLQGYYFGVPMTATELQTVLANGPKQESRTLQLFDYV